MALLKKWQTKKLKEHILNRLEQNAEMTGVFLQQSARARLVAIADPDWGQAYRRKILARMIVHEIERKPNEVVLTVGVSKDASMLGYTTVPDDMSHFGFYIEMGSRRFPAHPYLRPAVFGQARQVTDFMTAGIGS